MFFKGFPVIMVEKAYFVYRPRTAADLYSANPGGKRLQYRIVKTVCLRRIDFENFYLDLLADRQFLEDHAALCTEKGDCLLIKSKGPGGELLVIPDGCYVRYAALRPSIVISTQQMCMHPRD